MPTGYTAAIKDGITFEQFALNCARNFGALIMMRDEPSDAEIPEAFQPSTWNATRLVAAREALAAVEAMTDDECRTQAAIDHKVACDYWHKKLRENGELESKYFAMLAEVKAWTPPSPDHQGLRKFMESQIEDSIKFDCGHAPDEPVLLSADEWRAAKIEHLTRDIAYHEKADAEEVERTASRNLWVKQLRESLAQTAAT